MTFGGSAVTLAILVFGCSIYVLEREAQPDIMDLNGAMFLGMQVLLTGWASDTYDYYDPVTWAGKYVCVTGTVFGLFLIAYLIGVVSQHLIPSTFELTALNWVVHNRIATAEKDAAARLIQFVYRSHRRDKELLEKHKHNQEEYDRISELEEKEFMQTYLRMSKELQDLRRERMEFDQLMDPTSRTNISPVAQLFSDEIRKVQEGLEAVKQNHQTSQEGVARIEAMLAKSMKEPENTT